MIRIDILQLVDRLEQLLDEGRKVPLSRYVFVDPEIASSILGQMRISVPREIEMARALEKDCDRILAEANEEAARLLAEARDEANRILDENALYDQAAIEAKNLLLSARAEADEIRSGADQYAIAQLAVMESEVVRVLETVRNGLELLQANVDGDGSQGDKQKDS